MRRFREKYMDNNHYSDIKRELKDCKKIGHWIWYIFPVDHHYLKIVEIISDNSNHYMLQPGEIEQFIADRNIYPRYIELINIIYDCYKKNEKSDIFSDIDKLKFYIHLKIFRNNMGPEYKEKYNFLINNIYDELKDTYIYSQYKDEIDAFNHTKIRSRAIQVQSRPIPEQSRPIPEQSRVNPRNIGIGIFIIICIIILFYYVIK